MMKNLKAIMILLFMVISGAGFAQTAQTATPTTKTTVTKKKTDKAAGDVTKVDVKAAQAPGAKLKKDGTLDKRYAENKKLKKDGTPDKRFKASKKDSVKVTVKH
jgi:hypothetical protein